MSGLPQFVTLRSAANGNYLQYQWNDEFGDFYKYMGTKKVVDPVSPFVKIEVVPSTTDPSFVHLKSSYSGKFFEYEEIDGVKFIKATAKAPEEDRSKPACTLFKPTSPSSGQPNTVSFRYVPSANEHLATFDDKKLPQKNNVAVFEFATWESYKDTMKAKEDAIKAKDKEIKTKGDEIKTKEAEIMEKDDEIKKKDDTIKDKDDEVKALDAKLSDKDDEILKKANEIKEKDAVIKKKDDEISAKDKDIGSRNVEIKEKNDEIKKKEDVIKKKEDEIKTKDEENKKLKGQVATLEHDEKERQAKLGEEMANLQTTVAAAWEKFKKNVNA
ncbi:hypothetical protein LINPERPRIM_LOCUS3560 [Linum perenne]